MTLTTEIKEGLAPVTTLLLDVDGVLTDGSIVYSDQGDEIKTFSVRDGLGIRLLMDAGLTVGIVTGRRSGALLSRCRNLGIDLIFDGVTDKKKLIEQWLQDTGLSAQSLAFAGDDLPDIKLMKTVGFPFAVANADPLVKEAARYVTEASGGNGAVREICELILIAKNLWEQTVERFL